MQTCLQRKKPFSAHASEAMVVRAKSQAKRKCECKQERASQGIQARSWSDARHEGELDSMLQYVCFILQVVVDENNDSLMRLAILPVVAHGRSLAKGDDGSHQFSFSLLTAACVRHSRRTAGDPGGSAYPRR